MNYYPKLKDIPENYLIFKNRIFKIINDREWSEDYRCFYIELKTQDDTDFIDDDYKVSLTFNGTWKGNEPEKRSYALIGDKVKIVYELRVVGLDADIVTYETIGMITYFKFEDAGPIVSKRIKIMFESLKGINKFNL